MMACVGGFICGICFVIICSGASGKLCFMLVAFDGYSEGGGGGGGGGGGALTNKNEGMCCHVPGNPTPFQTRLRLPLPDKSKTNIYPIVDKQYILICSAS